jgi:hypothetical protein
MHFLYMTEKTIDIGAALIARVPDRNTVGWQHLLWEQRVGGSNPSPRPFIKY